MVTAGEFKVHRRVWFIIESMTPEERSEVTRVLESPEAFARLVGRPGASRKFSEQFGGLYRVNVTPAFVVIFRSTSAGIEVLDLLSQGALDHWTASGPRGGMEADRPRPSNGDRDG